MSRLWKRVRIADKQRWNCGTCYIVLTPAEFEPVQDMIWAGVFTKSVVITLEDTLRAAKIADKAIADMISSADFHP